MFGEKDAQWCEVHLIYVHYLLKVLFKKTKLHSQHLYYHELLRC